MSRDIKNGTSNSRSSADRLDARVLVVAGVVVLSAIVSILDITLVAVAQCTFQDIFDRPQAQVAWTSTGYTLALAAVIPTHAVMQHSTAGRDGVEQ